MRYSIIIIDIINIIHVVNVINIIDTIDAINVTNAIDVIYINIVIVYLVREKCIRKIYAKGVPINLVKFVEIIILINWRAVYPMI